MEGTYEEHWISYVALVGRDLPANVEGVRDVGSTPVWGRYPGRGHGNPLQDSCQENPMDRGAWWTTVFAIAKSWTRLKRYSTDARLKGVTANLGSCEKMGEDGIPLGSITNPCLLHLGQKAILPASSFFSRVLVMSRVSLGKLIFFK